MLNNIPAEMKALPQWVCFKHVTIENRVTKVPYSPTGKMASVTDSNTWVSFQVAQQAAVHFDGIGFVLTEADPFCIIDLDNKPHAPCTPEQLARHQKIYEMFNSYTEYSTSGTGIHIIVKGRIPAGVHRDNVEVYSSARYMVCTGNVLRNAPIQDYQELLSMLYGEMRPQQTSQLLELESAADDNQIVDMAINAVNSEKFNALCSGDMTGYPSQSEADFALLAIIAFYTQSNEQVRRIFRMTALGKREKAVRNNTYLDFAIGKIRAQQPAPIDMAQVTANAQALINQRPKVKEVEPEANLSPVVSNDDRGSTLTFPPGVIGEVAQYFLNSSFMPIPEVALSAAIAMFSTFTGRQYNINGQGLSHYIVLLAETGKGKEGAATGIDRIFGALRPSIPMLDEFRGPSAFASGPALSRTLSERPSQLSIQGEFGFTVNRLNNAKPGSPESSLKQGVLDAYTKSSWGSNMQPIAYSDKEKNTSLIQSPNLNILGESTQTRFFEGLDINSMEDGLIPRLLLIESKGHRPYPNRSHGALPSNELLGKISAVVVSSITLKNNNTCVSIQMDEKVTAMHWEYTRSCIDLQNNHNGDPVYSLWSRAAATTARLSGLISVGVNHYQPVITESEYLWAREVVERSIRCLTGRFQGGDIGEGDSKQIFEVKRLIVKYLSLTAAEVLKFGASKEMLKGHVIPYQFLVKRTSNLAAFKNDKIRSTQALQRTLKTMTDTGMLKLVPPAQLLASFKYEGVAYGVGTHWEPD